MIEGLRSALFIRARYLVVLMAMLFPLHTLAQDDCEVTGVVFGFFNGVQTTERQASYAVAWLRKLSPSTTLSGQPITYELFYNDTEGFADFVETFEQRMQEHGGLLAGRFELFFSAARGEGRWWNALILAVPMLRDVLDGFFDLFRAAAIRNLTAGFGDPNMTEVADRHKAQIDHWASQKKQMLFLAHSQGNLFVNKAYAHALGQADAGAVRVVHVAPASPALSGAHTLADKDLVINGLRLVGTVAPNTDLIPGYLERPAGLNGERDLLGHGLLEIYLNPALPTAERIRGQVLTALSELESFPRTRMIRLPDEASHRLEKVIQESSVPTVFVRGDGYWFVRTVAWTASERENGWSVTRYVGEGMGGYQRCDWGVYPLEGWTDPLWTQECTHERVPEWSLPATYPQPDELGAYGDAPMGTVVRLNSMTYSRPHLTVHGRDAPDAHVRFFSGIVPLVDFADAGSTRVERVF